MQLPKIVEVLILIFWTGTIGLKCTAKPIITENLE